MIDVSVEGVMSMAEEAFALVEDGTSRAVIFKSDGTSSVRTLDGSIKPVGTLVGEEIPTADDLRAFRAASSMELSALLQEDSAS